MNYYDEMIEEIRNDIDKKKYEEAERLIRNELSISYVPKDIEKQLKGLLEQIHIEDPPALKTLSDEQIAASLKKDEIHRLMAVDELNRKNLRDHLDLVQSYLLGDGYLNGKVLLIDSLIRQEVNCEFIYNGQTFNPSKAILPEKSEGFLSALKVIRERFMKEPSMMRMGEQLLYKEVLMALPEALSHDEGLMVADKIINYILKAFGSAN